MRVAFSLVLSTAAALASALPQLAAPPLATSFPNPHEDPFYAVPKNIASKSNGQVLRSRSVHTTELGVLAKARQLFYRTTDRQNQATGTVATVWIPDVPAIPPKIFSYQSPEDALDIRCAPSYASVNSSSEQEQYLNLPFTPILIYALAQGWYVVNADDDGYNSDWLVGTSEGRATLDGIRATINDLGLSKSKTTSSLVGYSGGAHESVWAASIAAKYAPDLNIISAAYGGTPVDLRAAYDILNGSPDAALAGGAFVGLAREYPQFNSTMNSLLTPAGKSLFAKMGGVDACLVEKGGDFANVNFSSTKYFKMDPLKNPVISDVIARESLLSNVSPLRVPVPKFPRYEWHGTSDTTVPYAPEAQYVKQQCAKGADITFVTYPGLDHTTTAVAGLPGALLFVTQAFDNVLVPTTCGANISTPAVGSEESVKLLGTRVDDLLKALLSQSDS